MIEKGDITCLKCQCAQNNFSVWKYKRKTTSTVTVNKHKQELPVSFLLSMIHMSMSFCGRICYGNNLLFLFMMIIFGSSSGQGLGGYFPAIRNLERPTYNSISASSTCGLSSPLEYCISSVNKSSLALCNIEQNRRVCLKGCCKTCRSSSPSFLDLQSASVLPSIGIYIFAQDKRPNSSAFSNALNFESGFLIYKDYEAAFNFSFSSWLKLKADKLSVILEKNGVFSVQLQEYLMEINYFTINSGSIQDKVTFGSINFKVGVWHHISITVSGYNLVLFINGKLERTAVLSGILNDKKSDLRLGQSFTGEKQFVGLMQEMKIYKHVLTNREVVESMSGTIPNIPYTDCRCPESHPRIKDDNPFFCVKNAATGSTTSRLSGNFHPPEYMLDGEIISYWISELVEKATIDINLRYSKLQIYVVTISFYSPIPKGIEIQRSTDFGKSYIPWQFYSENCQESFNMTNDGPLPYPDSVNCLRIPDPRPSFEGITFQPKEPGPDNKPQRPFGTPGCSDFYCSEKLLEFVKATNVRFIFTGHTLVYYSLHRYFGVRRVIIGGTCDCYGHAEKCVYDDATQANPSYTCQCEPSTFTTGAQCDSCQPMYNDKPFARGTNFNANSCKKCECYGHASSCYYDASLDSNPNDRTKLGGGVCKNCQHNMEGRFCDVCKQFYYRPSTKLKSDVDACKKCECDGPGTKPGMNDCQKDDSTPGILAGQCFCKTYASGRQCSTCKDGYYKLEASNPDGCTSCSCYAIGTKLNEPTCHITSGQCNCKTNVIGTKCTNCKLGFYGLSASNPLGCNPCNCNPFGTNFDSNCDVVSGQCKCREKFIGRDCGQCKAGYFGVTCQECVCDSRGTIQGTSTSCDSNSGQCSCKNFVTGTKCDQCKPGYFALSSANPQGCSPCGCDPNGTKDSGGCRIDGSCECKELVTGPQCNICKSGTYGLGSDTTLGCTRCNCNARGTVGGDTISADQLSCTSTGQCSCISNVVGLKCDSCANGFYWNPNGLGCLRCNCDSNGAVSQSCNSTGFCECLPDRGVAGMRCDSCQPGFFNYINGRCSACGCLPAGSLKPDCNQFGMCLYCKENVEGRKCDICRVNTKDLKAENPKGCSGPPSEQGPPTVKTSSPNWVVLEWDPPDKPNGLLINYNLFQNNTKIYSGSLQTFNATGLSPFTVYMFSIEVVTEGGTAKSADNLYFKTPSALPRGIAAPTITNIKERSVTASWTSPQIPNGDVSNYILMLYNGSESFQIYKGSKLTFEITGLKPFTVYFFAVSACNAAGCTSSSNVSIATRSTAPENQPPPRLTPLLDGTSIYVEWDEPSQPNGVILFYDLYMRTSPFTDEGNSVATNLNPQYRNFTADNLKPNSFYEFRVISYTSQVKGSTESDWIQAKTLEGVPSGASRISPTAVAINSSMVSLSWKAPFSPNGLITRFEVFIYEQNTAYIQPTLKGSTTGDIYTLLVGSLSAYTKYQFTIKACNSAGCTSHSSKATVTTTPSKPDNQPPPFGIPQNESQIYLQWNSPAILNGPDNLNFLVEQVLPSFNDPPEDVSEGIHFPGFGFYQFPSSVIPGSTRSIIEFYFKTRYLDGVLFFASSSTQTDLLAIEFRDGCPWFVFDPEDGAAAFTISKNKTFNDNKWHHVLITRESRIGTIMIDKFFSGTGLAKGNKNFIGQISNVYVGALPNDFQIIRSDSGNSTIKRMPFIGCIRSLKFNNKLIDFSIATRKTNVSPLTDYCPAKSQPGMYFKGGGFLLLKSGIFNGITSFEMSFDLRTLDISAPLILVGSESSNFFALYLKNQTLYFQYKTPSESQMFVLSSESFCDGEKHNVKIINQARKISSVINGVTKVITTLPIGFIFDDPVYIGGFSSKDTSISTLVESIKLPSYFSGCITNLRIGTLIYIQGAVQDFHNIDFDGCPSSKGDAKCQLPDFINVYTGKNKNVLFSMGKTFTEYLFRVKSYHSEKLGVASSSWVAIRTGEGAPSKLATPNLVYINSTSAQFSWTPPMISGGLITYYSLNYQGQDNLKNSVIVGNVPSGIIVGLSPAMEYDVTVTAYTKGGSVESEATKVKTNAAAPSEFDLPTVVSTPNSLSISWKPPRKPNGEILFYEVLLDGVNKFSNKTGFNVLITGLNVYTKYTLKVTVCNQVDCLSNTLDVFTDQLKPFGVIAPQIKVLGSFRVQISWRPPTILNGEILRYEILASQSVNNIENLKSFRNASATTFETIIDNLIPGTIYYFRVKAYTKAGGTLGDATEIKTVEGVPENIPDPKVVNKTSTEITLQIFAPKSPNGVITKYDVIQDDVEILSEITLPPIFTVKHLKPYTKYHFQVRVCTKEGCGSTNPLEVYTSDGIPVGEIGLVTYVSTASTVDVMWNAIREPNGIITYQVVIRGEFFLDPFKSLDTFNGTKICYSGNATMERITCPGLLPNEIYTIYVNGSNNAGFVISNERVIRTANDIPFVVSSPQVTVLNSTSLFIKWEMPERINGILKKYVLYGIFPDVLYSSFNTRVLIEGLVYEYLLTGLEPYTNYTFYVEVHNDVGSRSSKKVTVTTKQDVPVGVDPPHLKNITSRSAQVIIQEPSKPNGIISKYQVYLNNSLTNETDVPIVMVFNLNPFTLYEVKISVCTQVGCTSSDVSVFRTLQDAPEGIPAPVLSVNGSRSIIIRWSEPSISNGLVSYLIQRRLSGANFTITIAILKNDIDRIFIDDTVDPFSSYDYRIVAQTDGGASYSSYTTIKTLEAEPEDIDPPELFVLSPNSILVKWKPPNKPNGKVISYCVKIKSGKFCVNDLLKFEYTLTNLSSFIKYEIKIEACTANGCNDSEASSARTQPSLPQGQQPPTAFEISNTSLRVRWLEPLFPNGPITSYRLERRTLESIVTESITSPTPWRIVNVGLTTLFDDTLLGIYSLQQYRVTCITTQGQVTSSQSQGYRTGPGIPLVGPTVEATPLDFSQISLQWKNPAVNQLRGESKSYTILYETVLSPGQYVFATVNGSIKNLVVGNLRPNTLYEFIVEVFNGAGRVNSEPVRSRTFDGVPQGFDAPIVYFFGSFSIKLFWEPPKIPNGNIANYTIIANDMKLDTVNGDVNTHEQKGLQPFTLYTIKVQVCTSFVCILSASVVAQTQPAAPNNLLAPSVESVTSTSIEVIWTSPLNPNGIMIGYELYRRSYGSCNQGGNTTKKCSYITCALDETLCGYQCYNPSKQICCSNTLYNIDANKQCCDNKYLTKQRPDDICCGGTFHQKQLSSECCNGFYRQVPNGHICCYSNNNVIVGMGDSCCRDVPFYKNGSQVCLCGILYNRLSAPRQCCGGKIVSGNNKCCGDEVIGTSHTVDASKICCGISYVPRDTSLCCQGEPRIYKVHNFVDSLKKSQSKCCGENAISNNLACCKSTGYDVTTHVCSDVSSDGKNGCGNGKICPISNKDNSFCNQCNFDTSQNVCYHVNGSFNASHVNQNGICVSSWVEVLKDRRKPTLFKFLDTQLSPFTKYEYYVVGFNTVGNTTSPVNSSVTLMAGPDELKPPVAILVNDLVININWFAPIQPNGEINEYVLYRIEWLNKKEELIYRGLSLSYVDNKGLKYYTAYLYKISACTTVCVNKTAVTLVYTNEGVPSGVYPPTLKALSFNSVMVNWSTPEQPNGFINKYDAQIFKNDTFVSILPENSDGIMMSYVVTNLQPFTKYVFRISACTVKGCSTGPTSNITTLDGIPTGINPPRVFVEGPKQVSLEWNVPENTNGIILYYLLYRNNTRIANQTDRNFTDNGVKASSIYSYYFEAYTSGGGAASGDVIISTPESSPEGIKKPTLIASSANSIIVQWVTPSSPNGVITSYSVLYQERDGDIRRKNVQLTFSTTLIGLKPYTKYIMRIYVCTNVGCASGEEGEIFTLEARPLNIAPPKLESKSSGIIEISWKPPETPNGLILNYHVDRRTESNGIPVKIYVGKSLLYIDSSLEPFTSYQYQVIAFNSVGSVTSSWAAAKTLEGIPEGLASPKVRALSSSRVEVTWVAPSKANGIVQSYSVSVQRFSMPDNKTIFSCCDGNKFIYVVEGLQPAVSYQFRMIATTGGGNGYSEWTLFKMPDAKPSDVPILQVDRNPDGSFDGRKLLIFWDEPKVTNGIITSYELFLGTSKVHEGQERKALITRLQPYTNYTFTLKLCNSAGCTTGPEQTFQSGETSPKGQIQPQIEFTNSTAVLLRWQPPIFPNGIIIKYELIRQKVENTRRRRSENVIFTTSSVLSYLDTNLSPHTTYEYKVRSSNNGGSTESSWVKIKTLEALPEGEIAFNVTSLVGTTVLLSWSPPSKPNGDILYYQVFRDDTFIETTSKLSYSDASNNLQAGTLYKYYVRACTSAGCLESPSKTIKTLDTTPDAISPPTLQALDSSSIKVMWRPPEKIDGDILKYQLFMNGGNIPLFEGSLLQFTVQGLRAFTVYSFIVSACTADKCIKSRSSEIRTLEDIPFGLASPNVFPRSSASIEIRWESPTQPNGVIVYYLLLRDDNVIYNGTGTSYLDDKVISGRAYGYSVQAFNSAGSVKSSVTYGRTSANGAPANVSAPNAKVNNAFSIELSWQPPDDVTVTRYSVFYNDNEIDVGNVLKYTISSLKPFTTYDVRIKACAVDACTTSSSVSVQTLESIPEQQPSPSFDLVKDTSIRIQWREPSSPNGIILRYELYRREFQSESVLVYKGPQTSFIDSDLKSDTQYQYRVLVFNSAGSASSQWTVISTTKALPQQVQPLTPVEITKTSFAFNITPPLKPNGEIQSYIVQIIGPANTPLPNITLSSTLTSGVSNLQEFTEYRTRVFACNSVGCAPSLFKVVRTSGGVPLGFAAPIVTRKTSRSIGISWNPPSQTFGNILRYEILLSQPCPQSSQLVCTSSLKRFNVALALLYVINDVTPFTTYQITVEAFNDAGGTFSPTISVTTLAEDPAVVGRLAATVPSSEPNTIILDWSGTFDLRSEFIDFILLENLQEAYSGNKLKLERKNREVGTYVYTIQVFTKVNGVLRSAISESVTILIGNAPQSGAQTSDNWYETLWFLALCALVLLIIIVIIALFCCRGYRRNRSVYVRQREPLPLKANPISRQPSIIDFEERPASRVAFTPTQKLVPRYRENVGVSPHQTPSTSKYRISRNNNNELLGISMKESRFNESYTEDDDFIWETHSKRDLDSGLYDDSPSPSESEHIPVSNPYVTIPRERVLFPDTHL